LINPAAPAPVSFADSRPTLSIYTDGYLDALKAGPSVYDRVDALLAGNDPAGAEAILTAQLAQTPWELRRLSRSRPIPSP